jgi:exosortase A-associated hydrolase 1
MATTFEEHGVAFDCEGDTLIGVVARPEHPTGRGVLIVVGGPQYRAGSHRQFVLLARYLAERGIASMRFDYRGMGDSSGALRNFEHVDVDIRAAIDRFFSEVPELREVALWGLCDAASASIFYAHQDERVIGLALLNPWVRTTVGEAKTYFKHYYLKRAVDSVFWRKVLTGRFDLKASLDGLAKNARHVIAARMGSGATGELAKNQSLPDRMADALRRFDGRVLLLLSGNDLTAKEFSDLEQGSSKWAALLSESRVTRFALAEANHTFSLRVWRTQMFDWTGQWLLSY